MTLLFRITLIVCALLVFIYVLRKIRHSEVKIADSTFWFIFALVILLLAVFPHIVFFFSNIFGIESPSNCVFLAIIAILLVREFLPPSSFRSCATRSRRLRRPRRLPSWTLSRTRMRKRPRP